MKLNLLISILFFSFVQVFSQNTNDITVYLDSLYNPTSENNYKYRRIIKDFYIDKDAYIFNDFYKSGATKMKGLSNSKYVFSPAGLVINYYENGNKATLEHISPYTTIYKKYGWYENGENKFEFEGSFDKDKGAFTIRVLQYWDKNNNHIVVDGNGEYEEDNPNIFTKGDFVNGNKNGIWIGVDKKNNFTFTETYEDGKLISGISIDTKKVKHKYTVLTKNPSPKKGIDKLMDDIKAFYVHYEKDDDINKKPLRSIIFNISPEGSAEIESIIGIADESEKNKLISLLNDYKSWDPFISRGINLPFRFTLIVPYYVD